MVRWLYRRRAMLDSFVMRAWRRWYRRWGYRLRVLGSFPTLWRQFCSNCGTRRWQAGNDEWYGLCMGCLDGYSRAALLEWGPGRGRMHESQHCTRRGHLEFVGCQLCGEVSGEARFVDGGKGGDESSELEAEGDTGNNPATEWTT